MHSTRLPCACSVHSKRPMQPRPARALARRSLFRQCKMTVSLAKQLALSSEEDTNDESTDEEAIAAPARPRRSLFRSCKMAVSLAKQMASDVDDSNDETVTVPAVAVATRPARRQQQLDTGMLQNVLHLSALALVWSMSDLLVDSRQD